MGQKIFILLFENLQVLEVLGLWTANKDLQMLIPVHPNTWLEAGKVGDD